jgi:hypothetical protein
VVERVLGLAFGSSLAETFRAQRDEVEDVKIRVDQSHQPAKDGINLGILDDDVEDAVGDGVRQLSRSPDVSDRGFDKMDAGSAAR